PEAPIAIFRLGTTGHSSTPRWCRFAVNMYREWDSSRKQSCLKDIGYENRTKGFIQQRKGNSIGDHSNALTVVVDIGGEHASRLYVGYSDWRQRSAKQPGILH